MTDTSQKILDLFTKQDKTKPGMVVISSEITSAAKKWGHNHFERLQEAMEELRNESYVVITPSHSLELTEKGYNYLFKDV
ncbi:MAG TPA: hypothetical protein VEI96_09380 [Thermodesulfovibrionales bacterium]|nr:hypothetical protein [Thermodesulfovibrionales bacterium]